MFVYILTVRSAHYHLLTHYTRPHSQSCQCQIIDHVCTAATDTTLYTTNTPLHHKASHFSYTNRGVKWQIHAHTFRLSSGKESICITYHFMQIAGLMKNVSFQYSLCGNWNRQPAYWYLHTVSFRILSLGFHPPIRGFLLPSCIQYSLSMEVDGIQVKRNELTSPIPQLPKCLRVYM